MLKLDRPNLKLGRSKITGQKLHALQIIRKNRRGIRSLGLTSQAIQCVEAFFALKAKKPRAGQSDVARVLGVSRQLVNRHFARAEAVGLIARVGRTVILMTKSLLAWDRDFVLGRARAAKARAVKRWKTLTKSQPVNTGFTHTGKDITQPERAVELPDRQAAIADLQRMYVPVHMRAHR